MTRPDFSSWLTIPPFTTGAQEKTAMLADAMSALTEWHRAACPDYNNILEVTGQTNHAFQDLSDVPFIPVRLFKELNLKSVADDQVFKTMTSSGTTGQKVSRIYLDRETAAFQTKVLSRLMGEVLGKKRLPMLVIDSASILRDRHAFSARGAGILGFTMFGQDVTYALNDEMELDIDAIEGFLQRHQGQPVFLFGFTFMIWLHFCQKLKARGHRLPLETGILLHGGGWKKLQDQAISHTQFHQTLFDVAGIRRVINYYGMVEQTGSIFLECEHGHLHAPLFADILMRDPVTFAPLPIGQPGLIETLSVIPASYPGHALLTEDIGTLLGEDDCPCGRKGKYFNVTGRLLKAETRGCSDTYERHA